MKTRQEKLNKKLYEALHLKNMKKIQKFLEKGADPNIKYDNFFSALLFATEPKCF